MQHQNLQRRINQIQTVASTAAAAYNAAKNVYSALKGRSAPASKSRRNVSAKVKGGRRGQTILETAPVTAQVISTQNRNRLHFGQAFRHTDYEEGGLRLSGTFSNLTDNALGLAPTGTRISTGMFLPTAAGGTAGEGTIMAMSPTAYLSNGTAGYGMFSTANSTSPVPSIARWFRRYRFRQLHMWYETEDPTSQAGIVQVSYDSDVSALISNSGSGAAAPPAMETQRMARFPAWTPSIVIKLIEDMKSTPADKLFMLTEIATAISSASVSTADLALFFQGGVAAITDIAQTASVQKHGRWQWSFVLDLYGFSSQTPEGTISLDRFPVVRCDSCEHERPLTKEEHRALFPEKKEERKSVLASELPLLLRSMDPAREDTPPREIRMSEPRLVRTETERKNVELKAPLEPYESDMVVVEDLHGMEDKVATLRRQISQISQKHPLWQAKAAELREARALLAGFKKAQALTKPANNGLLPDG